MRFIRTDTREKKALRQAFLRFLWVPLVLILFASVLIGYNEYDKRKHDIIHKQEQQIILAMIEYRNDISSMTSIIRNIMTDYIGLSGNGAGQSAYEALLLGSMAASPVIDEISFLDLDGMETLRASRLDGEPYIVPASELMDQSAQPYYREAIGIGRYQFLFSKLDLNLEQGVTEIDPVTGETEPVLHISTPLELDGRRVGYFAVDFLVREYLDALRVSAGEKGCSILLLDENGYLYNDANDAHNFGFHYGTDSPQNSLTIRTFFPGIDLTAKSGSFIQNDKFCSFASFENIYNRTSDYILTRDASNRLIFFICYDGESVYAKDLRYSYIYHLIGSWETQLPVWGVLFVFYLVVLRLIFLYDRLRFTDLFSSNRYPKATLRQAIKSHQFVNYYQPIINIQDGAVMGFEALSRWNCHEQVLPPSMFIDEILHYQLGQMLDENVFLSVREDRRRMEQYAEFDNTFISVNCCQQTFNSLIAQPPATLIQLTEEEKRYIVLELLEDIVFNQSTQERIRDLYKHNIIFAIDDFGTGNSNVAFIRSFENLKVKIDRTFVPVDTTNKKERIIIEAFVRMFIDQGLKLIVEGVETREQIDYLKTLGVSGVQGYFFSQPMTIDQLIPFIRDKQYLRRMK
jgi:EAL domain-containing protein (putative c-di-GMP-specific phosphodiesterase class I)